MSIPRLPSHDLRILANAAQEAGWRWSRTGSGHIRWEHPDVPGPIFTASTPRANGSRRARQKLRTALRKARE